MQLRSKITVARNFRIHHHTLLNAKHKTQLFSVQRLRRNGKNNTQTTGKAIQLRLHGIQFLSEHLDLWSAELQRVQVNQCQFCVL